MEDLLAHAERHLRAASFAGRFRMAEGIEVHVLGRIAGERRFAALAERARRVLRRIEAINAREARTLRVQVAGGRCPPRTLVRLLREKAGARGNSDYDALDALVSALLDGGRAPRERPKRDPEMVAYQPTPARAILELVERAKLERADAFVDLGSGLGRVAILAALLSGARATGIEVDPGLCDYARRSARRIRARGVRFVVGDARRASLAGGTVYFLYTPFRGAMLDTVLERLRAEALARPIRVCTYGPCTTEVARVDWLSTPRGRLTADRVAVFHSRQGPNSKG